jgi:hypothetical protein
MQADVDGMWKEVDERHCVQQELAAIEAFDAATGIQEIIRNPDGPSSCRYIFSRRTRCYRMDAGSSVCHENENK